MGRKNTENKSISPLLITRSSFFGIQSFYTTCDLLATRNRDLIEIEKMNDGENVKLSACRNIA